MGMQLSQFPLPDINKVIFVSFDQIGLVLFWASTRQACLPACRFPTECHPATVINGPADFLIVSESFQLLKICGDGTVMPTTNVSRHTSAATDLGIFLV